MGTPVGISFGSPTSGQGFNVAATVSEITANLKAVENPWNYQLTQLRSQDAAYTTLGTDLSNLTTSLQALTDFQGVLAQKEGSSSNTSVLQLTSASNSAISGSHTIVVSALAQTNSYYSEDFANSSDLINGNISISVNGGTAVNIPTDSGGDTLAQVAANINNANAGVTANVITDSGGQRLSLVSNTSGVVGNVTLNSTLTDATNPSNTISFTQAQPGSDASFTVDGISETSSSNTVSNAIPGVTFQLLSAAPGSPVQVEITNNNTSVETAVNTFVSDYNQALTDINTQEGKNSSGNAEPLFGSPNLAMLQEQLQSALTFITSPGITATAGSGSPASWVLQAPSANDTYTAAAGAFGTGGGGTGSSPAITAPSTLTQIAAALNVAGTGYSATLDPTATTLTVTAAGSSPATLATTAPALTSAASGSVTSFTQLGISVNNDGTLTFNSSTLDSLLNTNYQDVANFLQPGSGFTSFGDNFTSILNNLGNAAPDGIVYLALQSNQSTESTLNTDITNEDALIAQQTQTLTAELNQANYTLTEIPQQLQYVNELYSSISGYNVNP
ncbi:MAG TPA: flagellar filament capping protein FliD, partial [Acidobacteriaceae bacterium]|nr:flagellar filament capping protein FliD [Acidobacteriaceae bacterium]